MKRILLTISAALLVLTSCQREPIYEEASNYLLNVTVDYSTILHGKPSTPPRIFRLLAYDAQTGKLTAHQDIYTDTNNGDKVIVDGPIYILEPGNTYDLVLYSYDTQTTYMAYEDDIDNLIAITATTMSGSSLVMNHPDHMFVEVRRGVQVPYLTDSETFTLDMCPRSILDTYKLIITGIQGLENAEGIDVYIGGQASGRAVGTESLLKETAFLYFKGTPDYDEEVIENVFNTFGKCPGEQSQLILNIYITGPGGATYICREDITEQFENPLNTEHLITAEFDVYIKPREEGGFMPSVDEWDEEHESWEIQ